MNRSKLSDFGLLLLRMFLCAILVYYGSQKMLGLFGGEGWNATLASFQEHFNFPQWLTMLAIISEFAGSIAVLFGLLTRLAAFGIACTMATAAYSTFAPTHDYRSAHLPLALCGMALALIFTGAGQFSLDGLLAKGKPKPKV